MKINFKDMYNKGKYQFEKNKGLIFTLLSAGFEIAALVAMAKQAPKAEKILAPANKRIEELKKQNDDTEAILNKRVSVEDNKKEIRKIQRETFKGLVKTYALPVVFAGLSLTFMGSSYKVMRDRQIALGAAYITVENAFKSYRNRVKEKFGEDAEKEIYNDIREIKRTRRIENPETGEVEEIEETIKKACSGGGWELFFEADNPSWSKNGRTNYETLMCAQNEANIRLRDQGYLFLYDVFNILRVPEVSINKDLLAASRVVGWIWDPYNEKRSSWVSFGISDEMGNPNEVGKDLFNNFENTPLLTFNPDGNIMLGDDSFAFHTKH